MKANLRKQGPLHNHPTMQAKDAQMWEIEASIQWYESTLARYPLEMNGNKIEAPTQWRENLAQLRAERAARIGKK